MGTPVKCDLMMLKTFSKPHKLKLSIVGMDRMKNTLWLVGIIILICGNSYSASQSNTAQEYSNAGQQLSNAKKFDKAIQYFTAAIRMNPNVADFFIGRGYCYYRQAIYSQALEDFQKAHAINPQDAAVIRIIQTLKTKIDNVSDLINWRKPAEGLSESLRTQKPILYDISAEWCGVCRMLEKGVFRNTECSAYINRIFVPIRIIDRLKENGENTEEIMALESRYEINGFPSLVVQYPGKAVYKKLAGYYGVNGTTYFLKGAMQ
jgi:tetratricopeptide (TPR) repeat protein